MKPYLNVQLILTVLDANKDEINKVMKLAKDIDQIENIELKKESLHTIVKKIKNAIHGRDIKSIKSSDLKLLTENQQELERLSKSFKIHNKNKQDLKSFIKQTGKIGKNGNVLKVLMNL